MKNFMNLEKNTLYLTEVLQIKYIEKFSVSIVKVHSWDENQLYILLCFQNMLKNYSQKSSYERLKSQLFFFLFDNIC